MRGKANRTNQAERVLAEVMAEQAALLGYRAPILGSFSDKEWKLFAFDAGLGIDLPMSTRDARLCGTVVDLVMAEEEAERVAHL